MSDAFGRPYDLDQSGRGFHKTRSYLGPSLGWVETQILPERKFNFGGGTHQIDPGDQVILTEIGTPTTFLLPDVKAWQAQNATQPATGFARGLMFKDYGGNARDVHVTIVPFDSQTIDGLNQSIILSQDFETIILYPLVDGTGWYAAVHTFDTGTGGTTAINPTAPIIGNVTGDVMNVGMSFDPDIFRVFGGQLALDVVDPGFVLGNPTVGTNPPIPASMSSMLDRAVGSTQGQIMFRNNAIWTALNPGTVGQRLTSGGAGSNPFWQDSAGGQFLPLTGGTLTGNLIISKSTPAVFFDFTTETAALFASRAQATGNFRWQFIIGDGSPETGSNIGSNFRIDRYADDGSFLGTPISIARHSGQVVITNAAFLGLPGVTLQFDPGNPAVVASQTITGAHPRWLMGLGDGSPETGANAGSNFAINRYDDNGTFLSQVMHIERATGITTIPGLQGYQLLDADLTALAGLTGTNTIYYRSGDGMWSPVAIGANMTFTGGTLSSTGGGIAEPPNDGVIYGRRTSGGVSSWQPAGGGGGDVFKAGNNDFTGLNTFTFATTFGSNTSPFATGSFKVQIVNTTTTISQWSADAIGLVFNFYKSRSSTIGTQAIVQQDDVLGSTQWIGSDGSIFLTGAMLRGAVDGVPAAGNMPGRLEFWTRPGVAAMARKMTLKGDGVLLIGPNTTSPAGLNNILQVDGSGGTTGAIHFGRWSGDATGMYVNLRKSRGAVPGTRGAILSGDVLGAVEFYGDDGTNWVSGAAIRAVTELAPSGGFVDTGLRFFTFKAGLGYTEKVRIFPSGGLGLNIFTDPGLGAVVANQYVIKQAADNLGQGLTFNNTANDAVGYQLLAGTVNPNEPRSMAIVTNYPGTGLVVYNVGDLTNPVARLLPGGCVLKGTTTNDNAAAGYVGEYLTPVVFNNIGVTSGATLNVANISLTAGDWDIWVQGHVTNAAAGPSLVILGFNAVPSTLPAPIGSNFSMTVSASSTNATPLKGRFSLALTTTIYFVANAGAQNLSFTGAIFARRRR